MLRDEAGVAEFIVPPAVLREGAAHPQWQTWHERIGACVREQEDAIVRIGRDDAFDLAEGARLSTALGGLIATGGETACAMLAAANIGSLELVREIKAGVALGKPSGVGGKGPAIVTKVGAFGSEHALLGAYLHLRGADLTVAR